MEYSRLLKNKLKKIVNISMIITLVSALLSLLFMIFNLSGKTDTMIPFGLSFLSLIINYIIVLKYSTTLGYFKHRFKKVRQHNHLARGIQYLLNGEFEKSEIIFDKCLYSTVDKAFLNGLHKGMCINSGNEKDIKIGFDYLSDYEIKSKII